jgi:hypothetical protein
MLAKLQLIGPATDLTISCPGLIHTISLKSTNPSQKGEKKGKKKLTSPAHTDAYRDSAKAHRAHTN